MKTVYTPLTALLAVVATMSMPALTDGHTGTSHSESDLSTAYWQENGAAAIQKRLNQKPNTNKAKNVILFVGDGMGISTLTAGRIFEGQSRGETGEENFLSFEEFPYTALVKTYNVDAQVPDSAGTASALNTGVKTRIGVINTAPDHLQDVCPVTPAKRLTPIAQLAEENGLKTGIVSTARLTHATPAAVYATSPNRDWESSKYLPAEAAKAGCTDIASQITGDLGGDGLDIALGGGRANFLPESGSSHGSGNRTDGNDIVANWLDKSANTKYISSKEGLDQIAGDKDKQILGLFADSHMAYELERPNDAASQPTLTDMTEAAINHLSGGGKGYYLMVEAGRIDHAHHQGKAKKALTDTQELSRAVKKALEMVDLNETLILVTADHSHVFTIAGYPRRGNPILGLMESAGTVPGQAATATDGKPYTTLGYHNGPGAVSGERSHLTQEEVLADDYKQQALVPVPYETHGGEDVALFATGPWAHLATGTMEQSTVFHLMKHAFGFQ